MNLKDIAKVLKGGQGSGHFSHPGRPPEVGGSAPSGGGGAEQKVPKSTKVRNKARQAKNTAEAAAKKAKEYQEQVKDGSLGGRDAKGRFVSLGNKVKTAANKIGDTTSAKKADKIIQRHSQRSASSGNWSPAAFGELGDLAVQVLQRAQGALA